LTIVFTTRDDRKASATLAALRRHVSSHRLIRPHLPISNPRIFLRPEKLELTSLLSVRALSQRLLRSAIPRLDAILLNAGLGGFIALNWPLAIWSITSDLVQAATWPSYKLSARGLITSPQLPASAAADPQHSEAVVGELFCANVFGHYMLAHWLMPLLRACPQSRPGRIVWLSSIEAQIHHFNSADFQALKSRNAYEHTKRMTDLMALTSTSTPATAKSVHSFLDLDHPNDRRLSHNTDQQQQHQAPSKPTIHLAHPGVCATSIVTLPWLLTLLMQLAFYTARLLGSPWHTLTAYAGATAPVWLALADPAEITEREYAGPAKWGSAVTRLGRQSVQRTDVPGWGVSGDGKPVVWWQPGSGWGRRRGAIDATSEDVERFLEDGARVWSELEALRREWEARIERFEAAKGTSD
jgi:3-keto steroid reductase